MLKPWYAFYAILVYSSIIVSLYATLWANGSVFGRRDLSGIWGMDHLSPEKLLERAKDGDTAKCETCHISEHQLLQPHVFFLKLPQPGGGRIDRRLADCWTIWRRGKLAAAGQDQDQDQNPLLRARRVRAGALLSTQSRIADNHQPDPGATDLEYLLQIGPPS